ncbi:hypothetical protein M7I_5486 [Glarea lozoyensis 74030]|uniref:Uncharacterized protein n=1 Tax=Glarea lozoyensis (strain ATCC 74030 / MF5533) TaxID=1104152 RepID=H0ES12_GLAL7|nr:hypothetical protein M7I_5486 [Glarea lozoyensis 74030]
MAPPSLSYSNGSEQTLTPASNEPRGFLDSQEEVLFMQVFVEENPDRDTVVCATTAVILNVYEIMSERAMQRMNHIAGARALIKECGWNARSTGIGQACFWLNVGMELLSCLHFNWKLAWEPDQWGVDMDFQRETEFGKEEVSPIFELQYHAFKNHQHMMNTTEFRPGWRIGKPTRTSATAGTTIFRGPCNQWLTCNQHRTAPNPPSPKSAIAAECLVIRREQEEVLEIFEKIRTETGWKVGFINKELKAKWKWQTDEQVQQQMAATQNSLAQFFPPTTQAPPVNLPPAPPPPARPQVPSGIPNPLLKTADFSLPNHPYQQYYQPPNQHQQNHFTHNYI